MTDRANIIISAVGIAFLVLVLYGCGGDKVLKRGELAPAPCGYVEANGGACE